jgi:hypothetical protein
MSLPPLPPALRVVALPASDEVPLAVLQFEPKAVTDIINYGIDATVYLSATGDTFTQAEASCTPTDLTIGSTKWDDTHIVLSLSGGTNFSSYSITIIGVLASGQQETWEAQISVGSGAAFAAANQGSIFSTNGFGLGYAGQTITNGGG